MSGSAATAAAMSARERPALESRARTASGLEAATKNGFLASLDARSNALRACAGLRPQAATR